VREQTFAKMKYIRIRDSVYDPNQSISYRDMVAMRGFSTNVDLFQVGDHSHRIARTRTQAWLPFSRSLSRFLRFTCRVE
jgi:hypothetical protein